MTRVILHADMDAFYAAVEARENPRIAGRPIVVGADPRGGRGRGVVAACNYAAREYGLHSAMPISRAYRLCPHAVYLPVRMDLYARVAERIVDIFREYTDRIERLSIDEAFLDVTASTRIFGDGAAIARALRSRVAESERLTVSVGVAANKFIAKLASDHGKPDGLVVVPEGREREFLRPLPVERLWGVGPRTAEELRRLGFTTIGALAEASRAGLESALGRTAAVRLQQLARGRDDRPVQTDREPKQIGRETTFDRDVTDRSAVERALLGLSEDVASRLRRHGYAGRTVTLKLRFASFETLNRQVTLDLPVATADELFPIALGLLARADQPERAIRLVGISVSGLDAGGEPDQLPLFPERDRSRRYRKLSRVLDGIAERFGQDAVRRARLLEGRDRRSAEEIDRGP